jgi:hypothetical protein
MSHKVEGIYVFVEIDGGGNERIVGYGVCGAMMGMVTSVREVAHALIPIARLHAQRVGVRVEMRHIGGPTRVLEIWDYAPEAAGDDPPLSV